MKNRKELQREINLLERKLEDNKEGIKDNLKISNLFSGLFYKIFKTEKDEDTPFTTETYLRGMAKTHITYAQAEQHSLLARLKKMLLFGKNN